MREPQIKLPDTFTKTCKVCGSTGILGFVQGGLNYPNAPCAVCRYDELRRWLRRWCLDANIASWLWKHYSKTLNKAQRNRMRHHFGGKKRNEELPDEFLKRKNTFSP